MLNNKKQNQQFFYIVIIAIVFHVFSFPTQAQGIAAKTNFIYWGNMFSPNLGLEFRLSNKMSLGIDGGFNLWEFSNNKKAKHWLVQPELRYWLDKAPYRHYFGFHLHGAQFNVGGITLPVGFKTLKDHRYEGYLYGAGISYGYQLPISSRWNIEFSMGGGYARIHYDKFKCPKCSPILKTNNRNYFGITKASLSLIYIFKK